MLNDDVDVNIFDADESNTELKMDPILTPTKHSLMPQHFTSEEGKTKGTVWLWVTIYARNHIFVKPSNVFVQIRCPQTQIQRYLHLHLIT